jgi:hypothetical protein
VAVVSIGYDGTVDEAQWAKLVPSAGSSEYGVKGAGDWKVSAHPSTAQAVNIAVGAGWGQGVMDTTDAIITVVCDAISSGTRWDLIVMHRDWTPPGGATTGAKVTGTSTKQLPPRSTSPGVTDDQPLALVQWTAGQTQPTAIVDLRVWAGNGGMVAKDELALTYLARVGATVTIGAAEWQYILGDNDTPVWASDTGIETTSMLTLGGWTVTGDITRQKLANGKYRYIASGLLVRTAAAVTIDRSGLNLGVILPSGWTPGDRVDCHTGLNDNFNNYAGAFNVRLWNDGHFSFHSTYATLTLVQYGNCNFSGTWVN